MLGSDVHSVFSGVSCLGCILADALEKTLQQLPQRRPVKKWALEESDLQDTS